MKRILCLIAFLFLFQIQVMAETVWTTESGIQKVNTIGQAILSKNSLPTEVKFTVDQSEEVNAYANDVNEIHVYTGLLNVVENDSELAGVIAHEVGHIVNNHVAKQSIANAIVSTIIYRANISNYAKLGATAANNVAMQKVSRQDEYEADITGVDLMIKAGYNPLAMISFLYKISGKYNDFLSDHPSGDKRTMYLYDYLTYTYPDKVKSNYSTKSYQQFMAYATPIVEKRNSNPRQLASFNKKQEKLKNKRMKKLAKYKTQGAVTGWDTSYALLKAFATGQAAQ